MIDRLGYYTDDEVADFVTTPLSGTFQALDTTLTNFAAIAWTSGVQIPALTATDTFSLRAVGAATSTDILDRAAGDARYALVASAGVSSFNTRTGVVTLTSGDVTTALTYTPTSVTGLTGTQSVAAFKTGLSLVKADVGLGSVDNTADAAKNVLTATKFVTARTIGITGDGTWSSGAFDGSGNVTAAITFATVNSNVGSFGSATQVGTFTVNGKGLTTAATNVTITPAVGSITGFGTGVGTALATNIGSAGAFVTFNGAGGTPSSLTLTNATSLPIAGLTASTVTAIGVGSIELGHASDTTIARSGAGDITIEGNGVYRVGGTDASVADGGTGRSTSTTAYALLAAGTTATGAHQTLAAGATTDVLIGGGASALPVWTTATGSGAPVRATSPSLVTPVLGTPSSGTLTSCTGLPIAGLVASTSTAIGVGSVELGHASDTTLSRASAGDVNIEGNLVYRAGGTDVPLTDGGTGSSTASGARTNLGLGTSAVIDTGTSGTKIPLLDGTNTWTTSQIVGTGAAAITNIINGSATLGGAIKTQKNGTDATFFGDTSAALGSGNGFIIYTYGAGDAISFYPGGSSVGAITTAGLSITGYSKASTYIKSGAYTVSTLPSAATAGAGARACVTDALAPAFLAVIAGGGVVFSGVISDGTNWRAD